MDEQDKKFSSRIFKKHIKNLLLDPNNYRFIDKPGYKKVPEDKIADTQVQKRTESFLLGKNNENIKDLIASFKENGFLSVDLIQAKALPNGKYLVLEGNRRIVTLQYLFEEWKERGADIGSLKESDFKNVPFVLHPGGSQKEHLIVMGLKHINGNKRWNPANQAQLIEDLLVEHKMAEEDVCDSLGITKHALKRAMRTLSMIKRYKDSDFGDQFDSSMYSFFEEFIRSTDIKKWLEWDDEKFISLNKYNEERLFTWLSTEEISERDDNGEEIRKEIRDPIVTKSAEIREIAKFIDDENALKRMEASRSVTQAFVLSDAVGETKFNNSLDILKEHVGIAFNFSDYMKDEHIVEIINLRDKFDRLIPSRAKIIDAAAESNVILGTGSGHFSEITVSNFRRLKNVTLKKLNRINIFAGCNNSGKTTVLEAVYLLANLNDLNAFFEMEKYRGKFIENLNSKWLDTNFLDPVEINALFNGKKTSIYIEADSTKEEINKSGYLTTFELVSEFDNKERVCRAHLFSDKESEIFYEDNAVLCHSIMTSPYRENEKELKKAHAKAVKDKTIDIVIQFIKNNIDPTINKIEMTTIDNVSRFFVSSDQFEKSVDITNYGEGVQRVFEIALFFAYARGGVLLIDEFETAIHKSLLINFSKFVQELAEKFNVQVFLTSHSKECIDSFIANDYRTEDITAFILKEEEDGISCKYVEGNRLAKLIESIDVDIREG